MSVFFICVLIIFGIALVVLEILIVPGLIVGIAGGVFMLMGILWAWQIFGASAGILTAVIAAILLSLTLWISLKSSVWKRLSLKTKMEGRMNEIESDAVLPGDKGNAVSSMRPMGTVRINGKIFQASTEGNMIPYNFPIVVVRVEPGKVIVKAITE